MVTGVEMGLFNETGHDSIDERNTEARRLIEELSPFTEEMSLKERMFVRDMLQQKESNGFRCSAKQLFYLRDLYERFL